MRIFLNVDGQMCDYCAWIEKILRPTRLKAAPTIWVSGPEEPKTAVKYDRAILVHGMAESVSSRREMNEILERIERAATVAYKELAKGCESVDAVELAIRLLESDESNFELEGDVYSSDGINSSVIRDAAIMDSDLNSGSVGAVTGICHPITLAKKVMQDTDHVLIVESGVRKLVNTETSEVGFATKNDFRRKDQRLYGAIARDREGRLACGVSTIDDRDQSVARSSMSAGGTVLGCGIFADKESCCSVSSEDRAIYVYAPASKIIGRLKHERATARANGEAVRVDVALNAELKNFVKDTGQSCIGAAALSLQGEPEVAFKSCYFPWARCSKGVITSSCVKEETFTKNVGELDMPLDCQCHR